MQLVDLVVSKESVESNEKYDSIQSNIQYVNALFNEMLTTDEIPGDALRSYYVDFYLYQVSNGGFSQFLLNCSLDNVIMDFIYSGLKEMGAVRNIEIFEKNANLCNELGQEGMDKLFSNDPWGDENRERDFLNQFSSEFLEVQQVESILECNYQWLRAHPNLRVLPELQIRTHIDEIGRAIPDKEERIAASQAEAPRHIQAIRALCDASGQELLDVLMGDPSFEYQGEEVVSWYFVTNMGSCYMIDLDDRVIMFDEETDQKIFELKEEEI